MECFDEFFFFLSLNRFKGRSSASFSISNNYYNLDEFDGVLSQVLDYQVVLMQDPQDQTKDRVEFRLVLDETQDNDHRLADLHNQITKIFNFSEFYTIGVSSVQSTSLERAPTSHKVRRVVDQRK